MVQEVTDLELLKLLNAEDSPEEVTDPDILALLNAEPELEPEPEPEPERMPPEDFDPFAREDDQFRTQPQEAAADVTTQAQAAEAPEPPVESDPWAREDNVIPQHVVEAPQPEAPVEPEMALPEVGARADAAGQPILNEDGSESSEVSKSFWMEDEEKEVLIPTVIKGEDGVLEKVTDEEAVRLYNEGKNPAIGKFDTAEEATAFAEQRSKAGGRFKAETEFPKTPFSAPKDQRFDWFSKQLYEDALNRIEEEKLNPKTEEEEYGVIYGRWAAFAGKQNRWMAGVLEGLSDLGEFIEGDVTPDRTPTDVIDDLRERAGRLEKIGEETKQRAMEGAGGGLTGNVVMLGIDIVDGAANMLPSIITAKVAGPTAGLSEMGVQVWGDTYDRAKEEGKDPIEAFYEATRSTLWEIGPEKLFGYFDKLGGKGLRDWAMQALREGASEIVTSILEQGDEVLIQGDAWEGWKTATKRALYDFLVGMGMGASLSAPMLFKGKDKIDPDAPTPPPITDDKPPPASEYDTLDLEAGGPTEDLPVLEDHDPREVIRKKSHAELMKNPIYRRYYESSNIGELSESHETRAEAAKEAYMRKAEQYKKWAKVIDEEDKPDDPPPPAAAGTIGEAKEERQAFEDEKKEAPDLLPVNADPREEVFTNVDEVETMYPIFSAAKIVEEYDASEAEEEQHITITNEDGETEKHLITREERDQLAEQLDIYKQEMADGESLDDPRVEEREAAPLNIPEAMYTDLAPEDMITDAETMQYKSDTTSETGESTRLHGIREWDADLSGVITAWQDSEGQIVIGNGHQRHALLVRLQAEGKAKGATLHTRVYSEADGYSAKDVRTISAFINIAEGTGTAIDAAKVIRDLDEASLKEVMGKMPPNSSLVRDAKGLAKLGEEAFQVVVNDLIAPKYAALVGEAFEESEQTAALQILIKSKPATFAEAYAMIADIQAGGFVKSEQGGLFGDVEMESLIKERAQILSASESKLKKNIAVFNALTKEEKRITEAGENILDRETNIAIVKEARSVMDIALRTINTTPELNDELNNIARKYKAGEITKTAAVNAFVEAATAYTGRSRGEPDTGLGDERPGEGAAEAKPEAEAKGKKKGAKKAKSKKVEDPYSVDKLSKMQKVTRDAILAVGAKFDPSSKSDPLQKIYWKSEKAAIDAIKVMDWAVDFDTLRFEEYESGKWGVRHSGTTEWLTVASWKSFGEALKDADADEEEGEIQIGGLLIPAGEGPVDLSVEADKDRAVREQHQKDVDDALKEWKEGIPQRLADEKAAEEGLPPIEQKKWLFWTDRADAESYAKAYGFDQAEVFEIIPTANGEWKIRYKTNKANKRWIYVKPHSWITLAERDRRWQDWKKQQLTVHGRGRIIFSLFDRTGNWSRPYIEAGYNVVQIDIDHPFWAIDIHDLDAEQLVDYGWDDVHGVIAQPPCDHFSNACRSLWKVKDADGRTHQGIDLLNQMEDIIAWLKPDWFVVENPATSRINKPGDFAENVDTRVVEQLGDPRMKFDPSNYGDTYTKKTALWGRFNPEMPRADVFPAQGSRIWRLTGFTKKAKQQRSVTPTGFADAFFMANSPLSVKSVDTMRWSAAGEFFDWMNETTGSWQDTILWAGRLAEKGYTPEAIGALYIDLDALEADTQKTGYDAEAALLRAIEREQELDEDAKFRAIPMFDYKDKDWDKVMGDNSFDSRAEIWEILEDRNWFASIERIGEETAAEEDVVTSDPWQINGIPMEEYHPITEDAADRLNDIVAKKWQKDLEAMDENDPDRMFPPPILKVVAKPAKKKKKKVGKPEDSVLSEEDQKVRDEFVEAEELELPSGLTPQEKGKTTYFKGNEAVFTGVIKDMHGGTFDEITVLEGVETGMTRYVKHVEPAPALEMTPEATATEEAARKKRIADAEQEEVPVESGSGDLFGAPPPVDMFPGTTMTGEEAPPKPQDAEPVIPEAEPYRLLPEEIEEITRLNNEKLEEIAKLHGVGFAEQTARDILRGILGGPGFNTADKTSKTAVRAIERHAVVKAWLEDVPVAEEGAEVPFDASHDRMIDAATLALKYTRGFGNIEDLYGPRNVEKRQHLIEVLTGEKKPAKAKAGITKLVKLYKDAFHITGGTLAEQATALEDTLKTVGVSAVKEEEAVILRVNDRVTFGNDTGTIVGIEGDYVMFRSDYATHPKAYNRVPYSTVRLIPEPTSAASAIDDELGEESGKLEANKKVLIKLLGARMYSSQLTDMVIKEMMQNSVDSAKEAVYKGVIKTGKVEVFVDRQTREVKIVDNAMGMSPTTVKKAFFTIAGSKKDVPPELSSGGLGLAKIGFMLSSEFIHLTTTKDGITTTVKATAEQIEDDNFKIVKTRAKEGEHGTTVVIGIPETYMDEEGEAKTIWFPWGPESVDFFKHPLIHPDVEVGFQYGSDDMVTVPLGKHFDFSPYDKVREVEFTKWGKAEIYYGKERKKWPSHKVLSSGVYQFTKRFPMTLTEVIPYDIIIDIKSKVRAAESHYPFNNKREGFSKVVEKDIDDMVHYLGQIARGVEAQNIADNFDQIVSMPFIDTGLDTKAQANKVKKAFKQQEAKPKAKAPEIPRKVVISEGVTKTQVEQDKEAQILRDRKAEEREKEQEADESSFEAKEILPGIKDFMKKMDQNPDKPILHNNTNIDFAKVSEGYGDYGQFFAELGSIFLEMKKAVSTSEIYGYDKLKPENLYFTGISVDKGYGGVHIKVPYKAALLNPFYSNWGAENLFGQRTVLYQTMIHELAHTVNMDHDNDFIGQMMKLDTWLANQGLQDYLQDEILKTLVKHESVFAIIKEEYEKSTTVNTAKSLKDYKDNSESAKAERDQGLLRDPLEPTGAEAGREERAGIQDTARPSEPREDLGPVLLSSKESVRGLNTEQADAVERVVDGEDIDFSIASIRSGGIDVPTAKSAVLKALGRKLTARIEFVETVSEIPDSVVGSGRQLLNEAGIVEGFVLGRKAYLITKNISSPERAAWVAWHEMWHRGAKIKYGAQFSRILRRAGTNDVVKRLAAEIKRQRKSDEPITSLINEALAELHAAMRTGTFARIERQYGITVPVGMKSGWRAMVDGWVKLIRRIMRNVGRYLRDDVSKVTEADMTDLEISNLIRGVPLDRDGQSDEFFYSYAGRSDPFFSSFTRLIDNAEGMRRKGSMSDFDQWFNAMQKKGKLSKIEYEWSGIKEWMRELEKAGTPITRDMIKRFVHAMPMIVEERILRPYEEGEYNTPEGTAEGASAFMVTQWHESTNEDGTITGLYANTPAGLYQVKQDIDGSWNVYRSDEYEDNVQQNDYPYTGHIDELQDWATSTIGTLQISGSDAAIYGDPDYNEEGGREYREILLSYPFLINENNHYDTPGLFVHVRFDLRTDINGNEMIFIQEIQSDLHQRLRKRIKHLKKLQAETPDAKGYRGGVVTKAKDFKMPLPEAPYYRQQDYAMLAIKRMVKYAADRNISRVGFSTAAMQNNRWNFIRHYDSLEIIKWPKSGLVDGKMVTEDTYRIHGYENAYIKTVNYAGLVKEFGEDVAEEARDSNTAYAYDHKSLTDEGRGMVGFYDKMLPNEVDKFLKKFDGRVERETPFVSGRGVDVVKNEFAATLEGHKLRLPDNMQEEGVLSSRLWKLLRRANQRGVTEGPWWDVVDTPYRTLYETQILTQTNKMTTDQAQGLLDLMQEILDAENNTLQEDGIHQFEVPERLMDEAQIGGFAFSIATEEGYGFPREESEERWEKNRHGITPKTWREKIRERLTALSHGFTRHFIELPQNEYFANVIEQLRKVEEAPAAARDTSIRLMKIVTQNLTAKDLDLFTRKVVLDDLKYEITQDHELPMDLTPEEVHETLERIDAILVDRPDIMEAVESRRIMVRSIANKLVQAGVLTEEQILNPYYFRHQVLEYMATEQRFGTGKGLKTPKRAGRKGSLKDINVNYLEVEFEWLLKALVDIEVADTLSWIKDATNGMNVRQQAVDAGRAANELAFAGIMSADLDANGWDVMDKDGVVIGRTSPLNEELKGFKARIAMGLDDIRKGLETATFEIPAKFDGIVSDIINQERGDDPLFFEFLAFLADTGKEGSGGAKGVFSAINQRKAWKKTLLGDRYVNTMSMDELVRLGFAPEGYVTWQPDKGRMLFTAKTIPQHIVDAMVTKMAEDPAGLTAEDATHMAEHIRSMLAVGGPKYQMIIPAELAKTLDAINDSHLGGIISQSTSEMLTMWKRWQLVSPWRVAKYNVNNMSGDLDAVIAIAPKILKKFPEAVQELFDVMYLGKTPSAKYIEAVRRGVFGSGLSVQEIKNIDEMKEFRNVLERGEADFGSVEGITALAKRIGHLPLAGFKASQKATWFRENWMRYAAYLHFEEITASGRELTALEYGASRPEILDAITDPKDKAAMMARKTVGDYGDISYYGAKIRRNVFPFWSWVEVNATRYWRVFDNAWEHNLVSGLKTGTIIGATLGVRGAVYLGMRSLAVYTMVQLWNVTMYGDDEEELTLQEQLRLHINAGRTADGKVRSIRFQGALTDFLDWGGFGDVIDTITEVEKGRAKWIDVVTAFTTAPINKFVGGVTPVIKVPFESLMGYQLWPDVFHPRRIRDRWRYAAQLWALEHEYDLIFNKPSQGYLASAGQLIWRERDPEQNAYNRIRSSAYEWRERITGKGGSSSYHTPRSDALYELRLAMKFGDEDAEKAAKERIYDLSKNRKEARKAIAGYYEKSKPLAMLTKKERREFMKTLSPMEKRLLKRAEKWHKKIFK